jgi:hypothetical protein
MLILEDTGHQVTNGACHWDLFLAPFDFLLLLSFFNVVLQVLGTGFRNGLLSTSSIPSRRALGMQIPKYREVQSRFYATIRLSQTPFD